MSKTHEERMTAKKAVIDARIAKATEERGIWHHDAHLRPR